jgi:hypothetical protein
MTGSDLSHLIGGEIIPDAPSLEDIAGMAGEFMYLCAMSQDIPADFDGCALRIQLDKTTNRLLSITISPVDHIDGKHIARDKPLSDEIDNLPELAKRYPKE